MLFRSTDEDGCSVISGKTFRYGTKDNIVNIPGSKVAVIQGLEGYIVVDSGDVLLIVPRDSEQSIKQYLDDVKRDAGDKYL